MLNLSIKKACSKQAFIIQSTKQVGGGLFKAKQLCFEHIEGATCFEPTDLLCVVGVIHHHFI